MSYPPINEHQLGLQKQAGTELCQAHAQAFWWLLSNVTQTEKGTSCCTWKINVQ